MLTIALTTVDSVGESAAAATPSSVRFDGHGFGHGIGMSQYGAKGAAALGLTWPTILDTYYPGTARTAIGNPTIRVDVRGDLGNRVAFWPQGGMWASYGAGRGSAVQLSWNGVIVYQVVQDSPTTLRLAYLSGDGLWHYWGRSSSQINLTSRSLGFFGVYSRKQQNSIVVGELRAVLSGAAIVPVAAVPMQQYLRGVVPRESPASWPLHALAAQAVAARTFARYALAHPRSSIADICDTTSCQVYSGVGWQPSTDRAIAMTSGVALTYQGTPVLAMFSSSNGGVEAQGSTPYLPGRADPWEAASANPNASWQTTVTAARIQASWPSIGTFTALSVLTRDGRGDWGGRVVTARVTGTSGSVTVTGDAVRGALGLKSTYWTSTAS